MSRARFIGDPDNDHDGPNITSVFGLSFRKNEWRDVSELEPGHITKLKGNKHYQVHEGEGEPLPVIEGGASAPEAPGAVEAVALELAPDASGEQMIVLRSGNLSVPVHITLHSARSDNTVLTATLTAGQDAASASFADAAPEAPATTGGDGKDVATETGPVVPDDWRTVHHSTRMAWARAIKQGAVKDAAEADYIISEYRGEDADDDFTELDPD